MARPSRTALAAVIAALTTLGVVPLAVAGPTRTSAPDPSTIDEVKILDGNVCGPTNSAIGVPGLGAVCVHSSPDDFRGVLADEAEANAVGHDHSGHGNASNAGLADIPTSVLPTSAAAGVAPPCHSDGVSGSRVHLFYGYSTGRDNREARYVPKILNEIVPAMEQVIRSESAEGGRELGIRFLAPNCGPVVVTTIQLPALTADGRDPQLQFGRIIEFMQERGYDRQDRKYLMLFDGNTDTPVCGLGAFNPFDETPLFTNGHNGYLPAAVLPTMYSMAYTPSCMGRGNSGALVEIHELFHNLGAVGLSAPNSDGGAHCLDFFDIMCPFPLRDGTRTCDSARLDCGKDDYFNVSPESGSYLANNWNTADSTFLGSIPPVAEEALLPNI